MFQIFEPVPFSEFFAMPLKQQAGEKQRDFHGVGGRRADAADTRHEQGGVLVFQSGPQQARRIDQGPVRGETRGLLFPGYARRIARPRQLAADTAVQQRTLADVRNADYRDASRLSKLAAGSAAEPPHLREQLVPVQRRVFAAAEANAVWQSGEMGLPDRGKAVVGQNRTC